MNFQDAINQRIDDLRKLCPKAHGDNALSSYVDFVAGQIKGLRESLQIFERVLQSQSRHPDGGGSIDAAELSREARMSSEAIHSELQLGATETDGADGMGGEV